jgi:hypothetical protein
LPETLFFVVPGCVCLASFRDEVEVAPLPPEAF